MPTLNEAAVTLRLRAALKGIRTVLSGAAPIDRGIALLHRDREEIEQHLAALAADPAEVVKAIQGVVRAAVELRKFEQSPFDPIEGRDDHKWNNLRFRLDCALTAYRAALKGEANRG